MQEIDDIDYIKTLKDILTKKLKENPNYFDYIESNSATIKYIDNMKSFIKKYNI